MKRRGKTLKIKLKETNLERRENDDHMVSGGWWRQAGTYRHAW